MEKRMSHDFIKDFIEELFCGMRPEGLYVYSDYDDVYFYVGEYIYRIEGRGTFLGHDWTMRIGATKAVFIFSDFDNVIKIGFNGELIFGDDITDDDELFVTGTDYYYDDRVENDDVILNPYSVNYIDEEMEIYSCVSNRTKEILLENRYVCSVGEIEITEQDKIAFTHGDKYSYHDDQKQWETIKNTSPQIQDFIVENCSELYLSDFFLSKIYEYYGGNVPEEVIRDLANLHDLHNNNIGYIYKKGILAPVILDYGGFDD